MSTRKKHPLFMAFAVLGALTVVPAGMAQVRGFDLSWFTFDGVAPVSGGGFQLFATVGQPDTSVLTGGGFRLTGGFLAVTLPTPGDPNCDGVLNFNDINPFVLALSDPNGYQQQFPGCSILSADCNGDCVVNFDDINPFVALLSGGQ